MKIITTAFATLVAVYGYSQTYLPLTGGDIKGGVGFDGQTTLNIINNADIYGRAHLRLTGRLDGGNDGWGIASRNNIIFAKNTGAQGVIGEDRFAIQFNMLEDKIGFVNAASASILSLNQSGHLTGTSATFSGKLGIGTTDPQSKLHINNGVITAGEYSVVLRGRYSDVYPSSGMNTGYFELRTNNEDHHSGGMSIWTNYGSTMYERLKVASSGNVGIGTTTPGTKLEVSGAIRGGLFANGVTNVGEAWFGRGSDRPLGTYTLQLGGSSATSTSFEVVDRAWTKVISSISGEAPSNSFVVNPQGNVGIGANTIDSKLTVGGKIHSREVKVTIDAGADFIFQKDYKLKPLSEVAEFISVNKHLPEVASAEEMKKNGLELGEMNIKLLQKIEELTLYLLQQNKRIEELEKQLKK